MYVSQADILVSWPSELFGLSQTLDPDDAV